MEKYFGQKLNGFENITPHALQLSWSSEYLKYE